MKNNLKELRSCLFQLLKLDYGAELYNYTDRNENCVLPGFVRISFYRLSSCYNAFCVHDINSTEPSFDWQYASYNKAVEKIVKRLAVISCDMIRSGHIELLKSEFEYYEAKANMVYDAKYSIDTSTHTWC